MEKGKAFKSNFLLLLFVLAFILHPIASSAQLLPERFHSATEQFGINWSLSYYTEVISNLAGGNQTKSAFEGYLDAGMGIDLGKVAGLHQTTINFNIINLHGQSPSEFVEDNLSVSNMDGAKTTRLQQLSIQYRSLNKKWGIKAGLLAVDEDYLTTVGSDLFLHGAAAYSFTLSPNAPVFPVASTALQARYSLNGEWTFRLRVFDADADNLDEFGANTNGFRFTLRPDNVFLIAEASWNGSIAENNGFYRFGSRHDTNKFPTVDGGLRRGLSSIYLAVDQQLYVKNSQTADGFYLFTLASWVFQQNSTPIDYDIHVGAYWKGLIPDWNDTLGAIYTYPHVGNRVMASNLSEKTTTESFLELVYRTKITNGWSLQGSLQYIQNPGGASGKQLENATVVGVRNTFSL